MPSSIKILGKATREDLAWAAGMFEGEGCVSIGRHRSYGSRGIPRVALNSTDEDVIRKFARVIGMGNVTGPYQYRVHNKPIWMWTCGSFEKVQAIGALFWGWLGVRRKAKFKEVLAVFRHHIPPKHKTHCAQGHQFSAENTGCSFGQRYCRICKNERAKRYYREKQHAV